MSQNGYELMSIYPSVSATLIMVKSSSTFHSLQNGKRASPVGSSRPFDGPSLLDGEFDQEAGEQSFQQALKAWRQGPGEEESEKENQRESERGTTVGKTSSGVGNGRAYSPVQTPSKFIEYSDIKETFYPQ